MRCKKMELFEEKKNANIYDKKVVEYQEELLTYSSIASMNQFVISSVDKPIVGTTALATCYGIVFYDRRLKKAYVGHASPTNYKTLLYQMISVLDPISKIIEYKIIPGWDNCNLGFGSASRYQNIFDDRNPYYYMKKCLQNNSNFQFIPLSFSIDIQTNYNYIDPFYEFAFDANTCESVTKCLFYENADDINRKINM